MSLKDLSPDQIKRVNEYLEGLAKMLSGDDISTCLHCGDGIRSLKQVGRSVYACPCGCRQYQGKLPKGYDETKPALKN